MGPGGADAEHEEGNRTMKFLAGFITAAVLFSIAACADAPVVSNPDPLLSLFAMPYAFMRAGGRDSGGVDRMLKVDSEGRVICAP